MIDGSLRRRAEHFMDLPEDFADVPQIPDEFSQEERLRLLGEIKARHYAVFAFMADRVLDEVAVIRQNNGGYPVNPYRDADQTGFEALRRDAVYTFLEAAKVLDGSDYETVATHLSYLRKKLNPAASISAIGQIDAGGQTAIHNSIALLENLPAIVKHHVPEYDYSNINNVAENSVGLPWSIAMMSIDQMMALQTVTAGEIEHKSWSDSTQLDPNFFKVKIDNEGSVKSVGFRGLHHILIPEGYKYDEKDEPLGHCIGLGNMALGATHPGTIGCPVTLLRHQLHQMWGWFIEDVERMELWPQT